MYIKNTYDVLIIGGGISACVFSSNYIKNNSSVKIAIIEAGRGLGGRSSTRISKRYKGWELNHGSPNFNICNKRNNLLLNDFVEDLLKNKLVKFDDSDYIEMSKKSKFEFLKKNNFYCGQNYISSSTMSELSRNIIALNNLRNQVDFYFETLIDKLEFIQGLWTISSKNGLKFKSKFLVFSSNLLLHKRSKEILKKDIIPLRKAIPKNKDEEIDSLLDILDKQSYIPRLTFLIYPKTNYFYKDNYSKRYRYFYLSEDFENRYKFERVVFQLQRNKKLGIVVHTRNLDFIKNYLREKNKDKFKSSILKIFNELFEDNSYINKLFEYDDISIMHWRASQPLEPSVPSTLQFCSRYNIGFCGDWINEEGFGRIEGAILSALKLANKFKVLI